jgi:hypothetical protein
MVCALVKEGKLLCEDTQRGQSCKYQGRISKKAARVKELLKPPESGRDRKDSSSKAFRGNKSLSTHLFCTSGLQNCERKNFCCFKLPNLSYIVMAALEN